MTDRIKRNMQPDKPLTLMSLRLPDHVIEDLKGAAPSLGFVGYQALIRAYISNGLRKHLAEREAQRAKDSTVEEFSQRLIAHGVPEQASSWRTSVIGYIVSVPILFTLPIWGEYRRMKRERRDTLLRRGVPDEQI